MSLSLVSISATNDAVSDTSSSLKGNIGDDVTINASYKLNYVQYFDVTTPLITYPDNTLVNATDAQYYIYTEQGGFLKYFKGQFLRIAIYLPPPFNANVEIAFTVVEVIDDNTIKTNFVFGNDSLSGNNYYLWSDDFPDTIEIQAGFDGYASLLTGNTETYKFINGVGKTDAEIFDARGITSNYSINNTTKDITLSFTIKDKIGSYLFDGDIPQEYFIGINAYDSNDTNNQLSLQSSIDCNIGGFGKHYNTNDFIPSVVDFRVKNLAGDTIEGIDLYNENVIEIDVDNTEQDYLVIFCVNNPNYTSDLTQHLERSILLDKVSRRYMLDPLGAYGYHVFTTYSNGTPTITANIWLDTDTVTWIKDNAITDYKIFIKPLSAEYNSNILASEGQFIEVLPTLNIFSSLCKFGLEPSPNVDYHFTNPDLFETDIVVAVNQLTYDFDTYDIDIKSVTNTIRAVKGSDTIILDTNFQDVNNYGFDVNGVKQINQTVLLGLREETIHRQLVVRRLEEIGNTTTLLINYPFFVGFESNEAITGQGVPSDVYEFGEVGDGLTKNWYKYANLGYTFEYVTKIIYDFNGATYQQEIIKPITVNDYESNANWYDNSIKSFAGVTELNDSGNKFVKQGCTIVCESYNDDTPDLANIESYCYVVPSLANRTKGERASTDLGGNDFTKIAPLSKLQVLNKYTFTFAFNHTIENVDIYLRIFEKSASITYLCPINWEDLTVINTEDNTTYIQAEGCTAETFYRITEAGDVRETEQGDLRILI